MAGLTASLLGSQRLMKSRHHGEHCRCRTACSALPLRLRTHACARRTTHGATQGTARSGAHSPGARTHSTARRLILPWHAALGPCRAGQRQRTAACEGVSGQPARKLDGPAAGTPCRGHGTPRTTRPRTAVAAHLRAPPCRPQRRPGAHRTRRCCPSVRSLPAPSRGTASPRRARQISGTPTRARHR